MIYGAPACLVSESGHRGALAQRVVWVGSDSRADIPILGGLGLAPMHYEIMPNEDGHWICALYHDYPLLINGRQVEVALLQNGDVICTGELKLKLLSESETPVLMSPAPGYESAEKSEDKPTPNSTVTVVQIEGFLWIMFDLKSLVAYFLMTTAA